MKSPIDIVKGKIVHVDKNGVLTIKAKYDDWQTLVRREYQECFIQMVDNRPISSKQRKTCYALLQDIAKHTGMSVSATKDTLKAKFVDDILNMPEAVSFSLSNAPVSMVCAFQKFLVEFVLDWDIPCSIQLPHFVDDVESYVYACAIRKLCCVCGRPAEVHHHKRIGMGGNRKTADHLGMTMQPLCRMHHTECHTMPQAEFDERYHLTPIVIDKALLAVWRLNSTNSEEHQTLETNKED